MSELTFEITGMHCASCGLLIDDAVEDVTGVTASTTNLRTRTTIVQTADASITHQVIEAIAAAGYTAQPVRSSFTSNAD